MARQYLPPGMALLGKQKIETRGNQPPILRGIIAVRRCTGALCACGSSRAGQCLSIHYADSPRSLQLAITLPGWIRSSVTSGHTLNLDGCYASRGKTTPTLHFLCLHGSHAIDAVSIPSSLMLLPTVESTLCIRRPSRSTSHGDGRKRAARSERGARCSRLTPPLQATNPYPTNVW